MSAGSERLDNGSLEIYSLDVGQADATVMITEEGTIVLNDADEEKIVDGLETVLADRTIERTENGNIPLVFAASHFHRDHIAGLEHLGYHDYEISHAVQPDDNRIEKRDPETGKPEKAVAGKRIRNYKNNLETLNVGKITQVSEGDDVSIDAATEFSVLAPPATDESVEVTRVSTGASVNLPPVRPNENSAVYKLEGERSVLFMGDVQDKSDHYAESWLIQQHDKGEVNLNADILSVAHHGSANATSTEFLDRVDPEVAVISSDLGQQHNHPTDEVLKNLYEHDVGVYWTAGHGTTRTDLDETLSPTPTNALETTHPADIAALKHYCGDADVAPKEVETLAPGNLPEETPDWITSAAPLIAQTREAIADAAITNADTVEEVRQTLESTPDAHDSLHADVQADRDEHVTTTADVNRTRESFFNAKRAERAYRQLPLHTRLRANLPNRFGGIDHPLQDIPDPDDIEGPRDVGELPKAVRTPSAGELRDENRIVIAEHFRTAETAADRAVETATTTDDVTRRLRETPGAHKDFLYAIETPNAHSADAPEQEPSEELTPTNERTHSAERRQDQDRDRSLGL